MGRRSLDPLTKIIAGKAPDSCAIQDSADGTSPGGAARNLRATLPKEGVNLLVYRLSGYSTVSAGVAFQFAAGQLMLGSRWVLSLVTRLAPKKTRQWAQVITSMPDPKPPAKVVPCPNCKCEVEVTDLVLECWFCKEIFLAEWQQHEHKKRAS